MSNQTNYQKQTSLLLDFHVPLSQSQEEEQASLKKIQEVLCFLKYAELLKKEKSHIFSLKMSKDSLITTMEELLESSSDLVFL